MNRAIGIILLIAAGIVGAAGYWQSSDVAPRPPGPVDPSPNASLSEITQYTEQIESAMKAEVFREIAGQLRARGINTAEQLRDYQISKIDAATKSAKQPWLDRMAKELPQGEIQNHEELAAKYDEMATGLERAAK
jgi:hypothetical protein